MEKEVQHWVKRFEMQAHPEGGFYAEVYRCEEEIPASGLPERYGSARALSTSIYFLFPFGKYTHLHRLKTDEVWHFYKGGPLAIYLIHADGRLEILKIGPDGPFQVVVPKGCWFGARPEGNTYSLTGCTMAPGFDFADFEMGDRAELLAEYPQHADIIAEFT